MAIHKIDKGDYILVVADSGKLRVKGDKRIYSNATELKDQPREYEEVVDQVEEPTPKKGGKKGAQFMPELRVPPFSKQDIIDIIREAVANGTISSPTQVIDNTKDYTLKVVKGEVVLVARGLCWKSRRLQRWTSPMRK